MAAAPTASASAPRRGTARAADLPAGCTASAAAWPALGLALPSINQDDGHGLLDGGNRRSAASRRRRHRQFYFRRLADGVAQQFSFDGVVHILRQTAH